MDARKIQQALGNARILPAISIESVDAALPLADALIEGGLPVAEITFRTEAAAEVIALLKKERPQLLLGAGTVLTPENARKARECGAVFAVAPGFNPAVVEAAREVGLDFYPGVMTPSDIDAAIQMGLRTLKFFPAGVMGGMKALKSIAAPFLHTGVKFIPTGGVNMDNAADYLKDPCVLAVGGSWLAKKDDIAGGRWDEIKRRTEQSLAAVQ